MVIYSFKQNPEFANYHLSIMMYFNVFKQISTSIFEIFQKSLYHRKLHNKSLYIISNKENIDAQKRFSIYSKFIK